jgi:hypothetical protein
MSPRPTTSGILETIQREHDSPFGMLFLSVPQPQPKAFYRGILLAKLSTKEPIETSLDGKDGKTKTDWEDDEDNWTD